MVQLTYLALSDAFEQRFERSQTVYRLLKAALGIQWVSVLSCVLALGGWLAWVLHSHYARRHTRELVAAFGLTLAQEPWPLWSVLPVSCVLLPLLALLMFAARARERIQARVAAGELPFPYTAEWSPDSVATTSAKTVAATAVSYGDAETGSAAPAAAGGGGPATSAVPLPTGAASPSANDDDGEGARATTASAETPGMYFTIAGAATLAAWLLLAWLASLLIGYGVWAAAMWSFVSAGQAVQPSYGMMYHRAAAAAAPPAVLTEAGDSLEEKLDNLIINGLYVDKLKNGGWMPDFPQPTGDCPPTCLDFSAYSQYLGKDTCCCNAVGGILAGQQDASHAVRHLLPAMVGLAVLWIATSWMMIAAGCNFAHTQTELLTITNQARKAIGRAGGLAADPRVRRVSRWLLGYLGNRAGVSGADHGGVPSSVGVTLRRAGASAAAAAAAAGSGGDGSVQEPLLPQGGS